MTAGGPCRECRQGTHQWAEPRQQAYSLLTGRTKFRWAQLSREFCRCRMCLIGCGARRVSVLLDEDVDATMPLPIIADRRDAGTHLPANVMRQPSEPRRALAEPTIEPTLDNIQRLIDGIERL